MKDIISIKNKIFSLLLFAILLSLSKRWALGYNIRCLDWERQALLEFKDGLVDEYGRLSSWGTGENERECCKWKGVECHNQTDHVIGLNLRGSPRFEGILEYGNTPLRGKINPSLLELKHLTSLDLSLNDFGNSPIPEFISSLNQLFYLNLYNANFGGAVPQRIGNLSKLRHLDVSQNNLSSISLDWVSRLHSLEYLDLSYLHVGDATNWLQAISKLSSIKDLHWTHSTLRDVLPSSLSSFNSSTSLETLYLSRNDHLSFSTFQWFLNFNSSIKFIDFSANNITGPISNALEIHRSLEYLDLSYNKLEGGIPRFLGNMSSLSHLHLRDIGLTAQLFELMMNLSGPLEKKLQHLDLSYNMISGSLIDFSRFSSLTRLALRNNKLNGFIGKGYLSTPSLVALDLSLNNFTGPLPDLTSAPFLKVLFLHDNKFNGPLRESIGCLSKLEVLCLGSNQLEDVVMEGHLLNLTRLQLLELSSNSELTLNCSPDWIPTFQLIAASLSGCNIGPQFPKWFRYQTKLVFLDISFNQITEKFPEWLGNLASQLVHLNVSNNQIHGIFPNVTFSTAIKSSDSFKLVPDIALGSLLDLSGNRFTGLVFFLCYTKQWRLLDLSDNLFSGQLPECFANFSSLQFLNLANNNLSGEIPHSIGSLRLSLSWLDLRNNSFTGSIPSSMRSCQRLEMIDLGNNRLTGEIPAWIGSQFISSLVVLSLRSNEFYGAIPSSMCSLERIQVLDLSSNNISGVIPKCLQSLKAMTKNPSPFKLDYLRGWVHPNLDDAFSAFRGLLDGAYFMWKGQEVKYINGLTLVTIIDLSNNNLGGDIPSEITKLVGLVGLNLSRNNLTGSIPQQIGLLNFLDSLDLSRNHLSGVIPISISELSFLGVLNLSYNNLSGRIPLNSHFDDSAYIGNSLLCGRPILDKPCHGDYETPAGDGNISMDYEHEEDTIITQGFYLSMGLGFISGFCGIVGTIISNKQIRHGFFR